VHGFVDERSCCESMRDRLNRIAENSCCKSLCRRDPYEIPRQGNCCADRLRDAGLLTVLISGSPYTAYVGALLAGIGTVPASVPLVATGLGLVSLNVVASLVELGFTENCNIDRLKGSTLVKTAGVYVLSIIASIWISDSLK